MARPKYGTPDAENPEWTAAEIRTAKPFAEMFPELAAQELKRRSRGPQKAPTKQLISLRVDADVLEKFRATGKGWQARMNATLAAHAPQRPTRTRMPRAKRRVRRVS